MVDSTPWSRLGLGTVQFGLPYGVANVAGQVPYAAVLRILERSAEAGITLIDTARAYGTSEAALGSALAELGLAGTFTVCTKLDIAPDYDSRADASVLDEVRAVLDASREALRLRSLPVVQLHVPAHRTWRGGVIWELLGAQRRAGAIGSLGVSMTGADLGEALACLADPAVEVLQIPYNAFDQRWRLGGVLGRASARVRVLGRSPYLQGLLAMPLDRVPDRLSSALPWKRIFLEIASDAGLEPAELALRYSLSSRELWTTIAGVDTLEQLEMNLRYAAMGPLSQSVLARVEAELSAVPESVAVPQLWGK